MQSLIQERELSFSYLSKAQVLYNTWNRLQTKSTNYLQTIENVVSQRHASISTDVTMYNVNVNQLIHQQSIAIEKTMTLLKETMHLFEQVQQDWKMLDLETARVLLKVKPVEQVPLSTQALIQVTAVPPHQVHEWISLLACEFQEDYTQKSIMMTTLSQHISTPDLLQRFIERWCTEPNVDKIMDTIVERIQLYKQVKKVLESV